MKKVIISALILAVVSGSVCMAVETVFIDSNRLLMESREGRAIRALNEKDKEEAMKLEYEQSKKVAELRNEIEEGVKAGKAGEESLQKKYKELGRLQRKAKYLVEDAREELEDKTKERVYRFRNKVFTVAREHFKKGGKNVLDVGTPGVIFVADSSDKTDGLLKELNVRYEKERAKSALTKGGNKKA